MELPLRSAALGESLHRVASTSRRGNSERSRTQQASEVRACLLYTSEAPQELDAPDPRQMQVEQDQIRLLPLHEGQRLTSRRRIENLDIWQGHEQAPQAIAYDGVIVHDENLHDSASVSGAATGAGRGRYAVTLAPLPST